MDRRKVLDDVWNKIVEHLKDNGYVEMASCNKDYSRYLVPSGKENEVTYQGKPNKSLRISDHWHWMSRRGGDYVQCPLEYFKRPTELNKPIHFIRIAWYDGEKYIFIAGERKIQRGPFVWDVKSTEELFEKIDNLIKG